MAAVNETLVSENNPAVKLREMRLETLPIVYLALYISGMALIAGASWMQDPLHGGIPALILFLLPPFVWILRTRSQTIAAWALIVGCIAVVMILASYSQVPVTVILLTLPVGFASIFISVPAGIAISTVCTLLLSLPFLNQGIHPSLRTATLIELWSIVGLIWLTERPLLTAIQWSWTSWERSRDLLEKARDTQVQLKQTTADLTDANTQLMRLNNMVKGLYQAAEDARQAKEQFVANVSHELRTPLNMIIGFTEMIMQAPSLYGKSIPSTLLADLDVVLHNSQHLLSLIDDVLDLSQIEAGRMALSKEKNKLAEIIQAATIAVQPLFESKGLYLKIELDDPLTLLCDRTRIRQVILNLLSNAGRLTEQGGVSIKAWREGNDVIIRITDTGPGIASEDLDKLFKPFQILDSSLRRRHSGSGLGLAISKSFVELHGGALWLESQKGKGTSFFIRLPIEPPAPLGEHGVLRWINPYTTREFRTRRSLAQVPNLRPRILVLENHTSMHRLLDRYMHEVEIVSVTNLESAAQELARTPAQALVVNAVSVPETLQMLEKTPLPQGTPAIICSFFPSELVEGDLRIAKYLVKPVTREQLLGVVTRLQPEAKTILIIEDDPDAQRLYQRMLSSVNQGYRVLRATDGKQALHLLEHKRPDIILLDLIMPEMDGFKFLAIKNQSEEFKDIPVVVISAQDPLGHPIVSQAMAVTRRGGLSSLQILDLIGALSQILAPVGRTAGPVQPENPSD